MPSQKLAVNAAWFTIALLAYNTASAIKSHCLEGEERTARFKRYRLLVIEIAGRRKSDPGGKSRRRFFKVPRLRDYMPGDSGRQNALELSGEPGIR